MSNLMRLAVVASLFVAASSSRAEPVVRHGALERAIARHFHPCETLKLGGFHVYVGNEPGCSP